MKVDFPQPESAATPITMGTWPGAKASKEVAERPTKPLGAKADAEAMKREAATNFMVELIKINKIK